MDSSDVNIRIYVHCVISELTFLSRTTYFYVVDSLHFRLLTIIICRVYE